MLSCACTSDNHHWASCYYVKVVKLASNQDNVFTVGLRLPLRSMTRVTVQLSLGCVLETLGQPALRPLEIWFVAYQFALPWKIAVHMGSLPELSYYLYSTGGTEDLSHFSCNIHIPSDPIACPEFVMFMHLIFYMTVSF